MVGEYITLPTHTIYVHQISWHNIIEMHDTEGNNITVLQTCQINSGLKWMYKRAKVNETVFAHKIRVDGGTVRREMKRRRITVQEKMGNRTRLTAGGWFSTIRWTDRSSIDVGKAPSNLIRKKEVRYEIKDQAAIQAITPDHRWKTHLKSIYPLLHIPFAVGSHDVVTAGGDKRKKRDVEACDLLEMPCTGESYFLLFQLLSVWIVNWKLENVFSSAYTENR